MALDFTADLANVYTSDGAFTSTATLSGGGTAYGIFDKAYTSLSLEGVTVESTGPRFRCLASAVSSVNQRTHTITIDGVAYKYAAIEPIGDGYEVYCILRRD